MINTVHAVFSTASKSHFCIALSSTSSMHISNNVADTAAQVHSNNRYWGKGDNFRCY